MKTMAKAEESDIGGRAKMKRMVKLLTVVALMVGMLVVSTAPGLAHDSICTGKNIVQIITPSLGADEDGDGYFCVKFSKDGSITQKDDHGFSGH